MTTQAPDPAYLDELPEGFQPYRSLSKTAVVSLILACLSLIGFIFPAFLVLAVLGLFCGVLAYRKIGRFPDELTGKIPALLGGFLSLAVFVGGTITHSVIYATEVPDGYQRVSFEALKAGSSAPDVPTEYALQLDGQRVFIKGYVYPDGQQFGIKRFVLVPDLGTCCFGGQPKLTHMIEVTLNGPLKIDYSMRKRKLAGTLKVDSSLKPVDGLGGVYYELKADYAK